MPSVLPILLALAAPVDFDRHVMGLLSQAGCNAGGCHGSFQGKGGLRLSLFGSDPAADHFALTREALGRRIDPLAPERSLLLLKATGRMPHGGGRRFAPGSWQYETFRDWIAGGAGRSAEPGVIKSLTLTPSEFATIKPGEAGGVLVTARFLDGTEEDVTRLCGFRTQDEGVARVESAGTLRTGRPGDTALLVTYRGEVRSLRVLVPLPARDSTRPPENGFIDREVFAKLRLLNVEPSGLSSDAEFLRRVTIDTIGGLPSPAEVREFLADTSRDKRARKIDRLLAHPRHADLWAMRYSDITGNNTFFMRAPTNQARTKFSQMWHDWLRNRFAGNVPYDEIVRGILCATGRDGRPRDEWVKEVDAVEAEAATGWVTTYPTKASLDLFWRQGTAPSLEEYAERTAAAFLGVRLECAQCHKHPYDRWTQADYRAYANVFGRVAVGLAPDTRALLGKKTLAKGAGIGNEVFDTGGKARALPPPGYVPIIKEVITLPNGKKQVILAAPPPVLAPKALGGPAIAPPKGKDPREALFDWMRSPDNPFFARAFVNRVWGHYFGVGIVHPVDDFSLANPPTNARLLDALAAAFVAGGYDIRRLERAILNSRTYQLSSAINETNRHDRHGYSRAYLRPMLAEVVLDVLGDATGRPDDFGPDAPPGKRAVEVGSIRVISADLSHALRTFGRSDRTLPCDCERAVEPSLSQTLYRMADPEILRKVSVSVVAIKGRPAPAKGRLAELLASTMPDAEMLEELFLATLSRLPTRAEADHFARHRAKDREEAFTDALWALLNTREFIVNH